jgi:hypothetical protein
LATISPEQSKRREKEGCNWDEIEIGFLVLGIKHVEHMFYP